MAADLKTIGLQYLAARAKHQDSKAAALEAEKQLQQAEKELTDAMLSAPGDGTAIVAGHTVLLLPEEWWDAAPGNRVQVHLLVEGG